MKVIEKWVCVSESAPSFVTVLCLSSRVRMLLLNTFDLAEDSITMDNVTDWITKLNTTFPNQFAEISHKVETCELTAELENVCSSLFLSFKTSKVLKWGGQKHEHFISH